MKKNTITGIFGVLILVWIVQKIGLKEISSIFLKINPTVFTLALLAYLLAEIMAALNLKILFKTKLIETLLTHMKGMVYSLPTPGRVGYYIVSSDLSKKSGNSISVSAGFLTILQGISFTLKAVLAFISTFYFATYFAIGEDVPYLFFASSVPLLFGIGIAVFFFSDKLTEKLSGRKYVGLIAGLLNTMQKSRKHLDFKKMLMLFSNSILGWSLIGLQWYLIAQSLSINISFLSAILLQPLLSAILFLPISPSGLGITEGGSILLFSLLMITPELAVAFMLAVRINMLILDGVGFLIGFTKK